MLIFIGVLLNIRC